MGSNPLIILIKIFYEINQEGYVSHDSWVRFCKRDAKTQGDRWDEISGYLLHYSYDTILLHTKAMSTIGKW